MATITRQSKHQSVVLHDIDWDTYQSLLRQIGDRSIRLTYDQGTLEIMSPSPEHERFKRYITRFIDALTEELDMPCASAGSTTWSRADLEKGLEPDECYYLTNEPKVRTNETQLIKNFRSWVRENLAT